MLVVILLLPDFSKFFDELFARPGLHQLFSAEKKGTGPFFRLQEELVAVGSDADPAGNDFGKLGPAFVEHRIGIVNMNVDSLTSGLLGEQYIDISVGGDLESLGDGDTFYSTQSAMNLERLISNFASGQSQ